MRKILVDKVLHSRVEQTAGNLSEQLPRTLVSIRCNFLRGKRDPGGPVRHDAGVELREIAGIEEGMRYPIVLNVDGRNIVIALIGGKKPGIFQLRDRTTYRSSEIVKVEGGVRILRRQRRRSEIRLPNLILQSPGR